MVGAPGASVLSARPIFLELLSAPVQHSHLTDPQRRRLRRKRPRLEPRHAFGPSLPVPLTSRIDRLVMMSRQRCEGARVQEVAVLNRQWWLHLSLLAACSERRFETRERRAA